MVYKKIHQEIIRPNASIEKIVIPSNNAVNQNEKIVYLGIQSVPGITFTINGGSDIESLIMVGATGVFELDLQDTDVGINNIEFNMSILNSLNGPKSQIIVDYITMGEG